MISNPDIPSVLLWVFAMATAIAAIYFSFGIAREWLEQRSRAVKGTGRVTGGLGSALDTHIATQWTEGRLRLDSILALIKKLSASLEQDMETLAGLDHSDSRYEREVRHMVEPTLRCVSFDQHLRDECRMLIPLLRFCAQDLAQSQGLDMTKKLSVLCEIQAAIESADRN